jgi:hypothetical protein
LDPAPRRRADGLPPGGSDLRWHSCPKPPTAPARPSSRQGLGAKPSGQSLDHDPLRSRAQRH